MLCLGRAWPQVVPFDALPSLARSSFEFAQEEESGEQDVLVLGTNLLRAYTYSGNLVELHAHAPRMMIRVSERPVASAVARLQARSWDRVTNLRHERVRLDDLDRYLLANLDGSHDLAALEEILLSAPVPPPGKPNSDDRTEADVSSTDDPTDGLRERLSWFARAALLVG